MAEWLGRVWTPMLLGAIGVLGMSACGPADGGTVEPVAPVVDALVQPATASLTVGEQRTAVFLVNFLDDPSQPFSVAQANDVVFGQVSDYYRENSRGLAWLSGTVFGWSTIPVASTSCDVQGIAAEAKKAAAAGGADLSGYSRYVYVFPSTSACGWSGLQAATEVWINGIMTLQNVGHEIGHTFGLLHAHGLNCDVSALGSTCVAVPYGDTTDIMGHRAGHLNAMFKEQLGWLGAAGTPPITTAAASGIYSLEAYESSGNGPKALKIPKGVDPSTGARTWYYVEYRQPIGFDAVLSALNAVFDGVLVRTGTEGDPDSSYLLDMTPETFPGSYNSDLMDPALGAGRSYVDPVAGVTIALLSADGATATVAVTLAAPQPATAPAPANSPPVAIDDAATTSQRSAVTIPVLANDRDPDGQRLQVTSVTAPASGKVVINADQTVTYSPSSRFSGADSFTYTVSDGAATATARITVQVVAKTKR